jgi:hypothetical protein
MRVAGKALSLNPIVFDGKHGTVLDSGTTYAYLPEPVFVAFKDAVRFYSCCSLFWIISYFFEVILLRFSRRLVKTLKLNDLSISQFFLNDINEGAICSYRYD